MPNVLCCVRAWTSREITCWRRARNCLLQNFQTFIFYRWTLQCLITGEDSLVPCFIVVGTTRGYISSRTKRYRPTCLFVWIQSPLLLKQKCASHESCFVDRRLFSVRAWYWAEWCKNVPLIIPEPYARLVSVRDWCSQFSARCDGWQYVGYQRTSYRRYDIYSWPPTSAFIIKRQRWQFSDNGDKAGKEIQLWALEVSSSQIGLERRLPHVVLSVRSCTPVMKVPPVTKGMLLLSPALVIVIISSTSIRKEQGRKKSDASEPTCVTATAIVFLYSSRSRQV